MMAHAQRLLPVWTVFRRSYAYAWERRDVLAVPYLIYAAITTALDLTLDRITGGSKPATLFALLIDQAFGMAFAVAIQRFVLLGEAGKGASFFRWDRFFRTYLINALLLGFAIGLSAVFLLGLFENIGIMMGVVDAESLRPIPSPRASALSLLGLIAAITIGAFVSRVLLTLPAAALGQEDRLRIVWAATTGNGLRLLAASILVLLPFVTIEAALLRATLDNQGGIVSNGPLSLAIEILSGLVAPLQLVVFTIMLALDYDALIRGGGPGRRLS
jgi:hypothetical protein